jgi:hypothetical protein
MLGPEVNLSSTGCYGDGIVKRIAPPNMESVAVMDFKYAE